ncbi:MAG: hypothetical protein WA584_08455 [Pyrinomonadaceae bacterium]
MMSEEGIKNLWEWVDKTYVQPEVQRRRQNDLLPDDFKIRQFRILMPKNREVIVQFNDEIDWIANAKRGDGQEFIMNTPVYIYELDKIESVEPPQVNGERTAFIFFGWDGNQYQGCFEFSPNWTEEERIAHGLAKDDEWTLNPFLTHFLQGRIEEKAAQMCLDNKDLLRSFGLWLVPILIPYPLAQIAEYLNLNNEETARNLLVAFCNSEFLEKLVSAWWHIQEFQFRRSLIEEALWAHKERKYHLSVSTLLPHIEGIIVHWEFNQGMNTRFRAESRIKDFQNTTQGEAKSPFLYNSVHGTTIDFILTGPVLSTFQNWQDDLDPAFPNRNAIGHGRYEPFLFTEEASIKVFLLLDTVKQLIAAQNQNLLNTEGDTN